MNENTDSLPQDSDFLAPRHCFREPIPEIFHAAELLDKAVDAHLAGDRRRAGRLIAEANMQEVWDWTESIWGKDKHGIRRIRAVEGMPGTICKSGRDPKRKPTAEQKRALIERDGRRCGFCGIPLIREEIRIAMRKQYADELKWGRSNDSQHAAFQCMWVQYDHVTPYSRGGLTNLENLLIACSACNYGRGELMLEEVGLIDPRTRPEAKPAWDRKETWDGLERFINR